MFYLKFIHSDRPFSATRMFYLIGIGLFDEKDITVKGLEIVKRANRVYLEHYTSILWKSKEDLVTIHIIMTLLVLSPRFIIRMLEMHLAGKVLRQRTHLG